MTNPTSINHDLPNYCLTTDESGNQFLDSFLKTQGKSRTSIVDTAAYKSYQELCSIPQAKAQPCGKDINGKVYRTLKKFFIVLRGLKKYLDKYVNQTINAVQNLQTEITATIRELVGILKTIVQRAREWVLKKVKKGLEDALFVSETPQTSEPKKALLSAIIDEIFCRFDEIIAGLFNLVGEFLYALIGKVINVPFCAIESFINALLSKLLNDIDNALAPLFNKINKILGPVSKIMGSVFQVIDYILGFESFLCEKPECNDELKEFEAGPWGKPQNSKTDNWSNFSFSQGISKSVNGWMDDFFGAGKGGNYTSPGGCYSGTFNCGMDVQIFGGGGSGAVGAAVVNKIGQVVGVNLFYGGESYTSPPFVSFVDSGGCGSGAAGHANITDNGEIEDIVIDNPGIGYSTLSPFPPVIRNFSSVPTSVETDKPLTFVWETENATNVTLSSEDYTLTGYSQLPVNGSQIISAAPAEQINFPAGKTSTIVKYILTAQRDVPGWERLEVTKDIDVEVYLPGSTPSGDTPVSPNALAPTILSFDVNPSITNLGKVVKFTWQTSDASLVGLGLSTGLGTVIPIYDNLIPNGSASIVLPNDLVFPSDGSSIINTYVLTAINTKAPAGSNSSIEYTQVEIVSPQTSLPNWNPKDQIPTLTPGTQASDTTGTTTTSGSNNAAENSSGSIDFSGPSGFYTTGNGEDLTDEINDKIFGGGKDTKGGGNDKPDNIFNSLPTSGIFNGGALIDPPGSSGGGGGGGAGGGGNIPTITTPIDTLTGIGEIITPIDGTGGGEEQSQAVGGTVGGGLTPGGDVISEISGVEIVNTGFGYNPDDQVVIDGGNNNAEFTIETSPTGQIVNINIISGGYGFTSLPVIRINSVDGLGARFRPILRFIPASKFTQKELDRIGTDKLLKVVDCILK